MNLFKTYWNTIKRDYEVIDDEYEQILCWWQEHSFFLVNWNKYKSDKRFIKINGKGKYDGVTNTYHKIGRLHIQYGRHGWWQSLPLYNKNNKKGEEDEMSEL
jgi:hypothetical protein